MRDKYPDYFFDISSTVSRHEDFPDMLRLVVSAKDEENLDSAGGCLVAYLINTGFDFPTQEHFHLFDVESSHAVEAYEILSSRKWQKKIRTLIDLSEFRENPSTFLLIHAVDVREECRGSRLALRLMREAASVFGYWDVLVILKAHPTTEQTASDEEIRKLSDYYLSDSLLAFKELDRKTHPGWLIGYGFEPFFLDESGDKRFYGGN